MRATAAAWIAATLAVAGWTRAAFAQSFFELSPGPLTQAHAELDNKDNCTKCHQLGKGVTDFLCLDCHQHQPLAKAIELGRGLHAKFDKPCRTCHAEHRGRDAVAIDWSPLGGRNKFEHARTGFALTGKHESASCAKCHKRKLVSGRISYVGLDPDCNDCHKNPHAFASASLTRECTKCHVTPGVATKMKPAELPFDHGRRTGIALAGKHATLDCKRCHQGARMTLTDGKGRTCIACHANPHGRGFTGWPCTDCHDVTRKFQQSPFDHDKTDFPLRGEHAKANCSRCHASKASTPKTACSGCHGDPHKARFAKLGCESCHDKGGTTALRFNHSKQTGFALTGKHSALSCRSCHRGSSPVKFEKFPGAECRSCHAHTNAHDGQFEDKRCGECHKEGGAKELVFDHQKDSRFPLTGFHAELGSSGACDKCHANGAFRTNKLLCADCHRDSHKGELGTECARCHKTEVHFAETVFDHDRLSRFPLEGEHEKAKCEQCHEGRRYKIGKSACIDCHADDDPHERKLGADCDRCHLPAPGAPKFDHETMTRFQRTGVHEKTACSFCHRVKPPGPLPAPGWTKTLVAAAVDRKFPSMGKTCAECHLDRHEGRYGASCDACHNTNSFAQASRAVHDTGSFRLMGAHDDLSCARCHAPGRLLAGTGELCQSCHREDDAHNNALGPYCGECHTQVDWMPPRFNHARVGFTLRGAHVSARCRDCHGSGTYAGTPSSCETCHLGQAMRAVEPVHTPAIGDCKNCHVEVAFAPAKRHHPTYPLTGAHIAARCSSCHPGGVYAGVSRDCIGCHSEDFMAPSTRPNHQAAGFSVDCGGCHTTVAFAGARYQHQTFILRGVHRTLDCGRCHTNDNFTAAFNGRAPAYDCGLCHGAGGPVDRWPPDHAQRGYPPTCELCHNELGWKPARKPR